MKLLRTLLLATLVLAISLTAVARSSSPAGFGHATLWNDGWQFSLLADDDAQRVLTEPAPFSILSSSFAPVLLPHDWSVDYAPSPQLASCTGYLPGGVGFYRKTFRHTPKGADDGTRTYLYFDGVYNRSAVYLNGHLLGRRPNGYISFCYDLTPWLRSGANTLEVVVDHSRSADSRWYTGSGIYRNVWLVQAPATHLAQWGTTYEFQPSADGDRLTVATEVEGTDATGVLFQLRDADGTVVATQQTAVDGGRAQALLPVGTAHRWTLDDPYLYALTVTLLTADGTGDVFQTNVGMRTLRFTPNEGFFLNDTNMKVKGVCLHHDAGVLGAAVPPEVWRWRLSQLKALGCNAVRCSHNPQDPALYDLCDELGLLMMDEASDEWEFPKRKWIAGWNKGTPGFQGTYDFFEEWIDTDVADMVRRDRLHPSIFLWSIGNEVDYPNDPYSHPCLDGSTINQPMFGGYKPDAPRAERIGEIAKRLSAIVRSHDASRPVTGALAGVYMSNHTAYPEAVDVVGYNYTENRYAEDHATYPDRIIYGSENGQGYEQWVAVRDNPYIFGQFIWTGIDYLGESGAWPSRGLGTGLLDFCGFPKMQGEMRRIMWAQQPGDTLAMPKRTRRGSRGWERGMRMEFPKPATLKASLLAPADDAEGMPRTCLVLLELLDKDGKRCEYTGTEVTVTASDGLRLLGVENGSNNDMSHPRATTRRATSGRIVAYVQYPAGINPAGQSVTFQAHGLPTATYVIE